MKLNWYKVFFVSVAVAAVRPIVVHTQSCGFCWRSAVAAVLFVVFAVAAMHERGGKVAS